jgi:processive 1,2-diacylglycerol beta-glucosyltransferase
MKKILIISLSAGAGHIRAAEAVEKTIQQKYKNIEVKHIDMAKYISMPMKKTVIDSYALMAKRLPELWGFLYEKTDNPKITKKFNSLTKQIKTVNSTRLYDLIKNYNPDKILSTHFLASEIVLNAPKKYKFNIPVSTLITDYDLHNLWLVPGTEKYFVATEKMKWKIVKQENIPEKNIIVSGIPIDPVFYKNKSISELKNKHDIPKKKKTILVMSGGQGLSKSDEVVKSIFDIKKSIAIIAIAGKNKKLEKKLKSLKPPKNIHLKTIGWTDKIDEFMRIADIIISKPGGITTTECVTLKKPIIATQPIPGQEEHNAQYILENNLGFVAHDAEDMLYYLNSILNSSKAVKQKNRHKNAAEIIIKKL